MTKTAVGGVATFTGVVLNNAGIVGLYATGGGASIAYATAITVAPRSADRVKFRLSQGNVVAKKSFTVQVDAKDGNGNIDTAFTGNVTLSLAVDPAGSTLSGTLTVKAVNGVATFAGLSLNKLGSGYAIKAVAASLTSDTTSSFDVTDQLVITQAPPASTTVGTAIAITVKAEDGQGNVDTAFAGPVALSDTGTLAGTATVQAVNGVATFSVTPQTTGNQQLTASSGNLTSPIAYYSVLVSTTPAKLAISGLPLSIPQSNLASPFGLLVTAQDSFGNTVTGYAGAVTLSLATNPNGAALGGTLTVNAVNGVATFANVTFSKTGSGFVLQATAAGLPKVVTAAFNVVDRLAVTTQPPYGLVVGSKFGVTVSAKGISGAVDTAYNGFVTLSGSGIGGVLSVRAVNGIATFAALTATNWGLLNVTAISDTAAQSPTIGFVVGAAKAASFVQLTALPATLTAGTPFAVSLAIKNTDGKYSTTFNGAVTLALATNPGGATLGGALTVNAVNGVVKFSGLSLDKAAAGYTLKVSATDLASLSTDAFSIAAQKVATKLIVTAAPAATIGAGAAFGVTIKAVDDLGNLDTAFNGSVALALSCATGFGSPLNGPTTVKAVNGVATFTGLSIARTGLPYTAANYNSQNVLAAFYSLSASSGSLTIARGSAFKVTPGKATHLSIEAPSGVLGESIVGNTLEFKTFGTRVLALDAFGNIDPTFTGSVVMALGDNPGNALLNELVPLNSVTNAVAGVAYFGNQIIDTAGKGYTLTATSDGLAAGVSAPFDVTTDYLYIVSPPSGLTAGDTFTVAVGAHGPHDEIDTFFNGNVTLSLSGGGTLSGTTTVAAVNGVATFTGLKINQGGRYSIAATLAAPTAATLNISASPYVTRPFGVAVGQASKLAVQTPPPAAITAGATFGLSVAAVDAQGNVQITYGGPVTLALDTNPGGATLGGMVTAFAVNGIATFNGLTLSKAGVGYTLKASIAGLTSAFTTAFNVTAAGKATKLAFSAAPPATVAARSAFGVTVQALDSYGALDTAFNGNITVALDNNPDDGTLGGKLTVAAVNGVAQFTGLLLSDVGSYSLSASSSGLSDAETSNFNVTPAAARQLVVSGPNGDVLAGAAFSLTVAAADAVGQIDSNFSGTITLALADHAAGALSGTLTAKAVAGVATFTGLSISAAGSGYTLRATATGVATGLTAPFAVSADRLVVTTAPPAAVGAGQNFGLTVAAKNAAGAIDTAFTGNVTVTPLDAAATLTGTVTVAAVNGVATFAGLALSPAGYYTLSITADKAARAVTGPINVTAAAGTRLLVTTPAPTTVTAGGAFGIGISVEDANGFVDTKFQGVISIALGTNPGSASLDGLTYVKAVDGVATFTDLSLDKTGTGYTLVASGAGLTSVTTAPIKVAAAAVATRLVVTTQPPSVTAGSGFSLAIKAVDDKGVLDTTFAGSVKLAFGSSTTGSPTLGGTLTVTAVKGVATFTGLTVNLANYAYRLDASSGTLGVATTSAFDVTAGQATKLSITAPDNVLTANPFALTIFAQDAFGNVDRTYTGTATIALAANAAGAALAGTLTSAAANGVMNFPGLTLSKAGAGFTIKATAAGVTAATSAAFDVTGDHVVVTASPPAALGAGKTFGLSVSAETVAGAIDAAYTGNVTVALLNLGTGTATLAGTLTKAAASGVATFSGLSISAPGAYLLTITAANAGTTSTDVITITGATPALLAPVVTKDPLTQSAIAGSTVTFTAAANGNPTPTVKWQVSTNYGSSFSDIAGATAGTYSFAATAALTGRVYRAVFTNSKGSVNTAPATLTVNQQYTIAPGNSGYTEPAGTWAAGGVTGYGGATTRASSTAGASAKWVQTLPAGYYTVGFYNVVGAAMPPARK